MTSYRAMLEGLRKSGNVMGYGLLTAAACGAIWSGDRRQRAGYCATTRQCPRCNKEPDTAFHRVWHCEKNTGKKAYVLSAGLAARAEEQKESAPAFWVRGIIPKRWLECTPPVSVEKVVVHTPTGDTAMLCGEEVLTGQTQAAADGTTPGGGSTTTMMFGDASGGPESASKRLRRVAWAVAVVDIAAPADERIRAWASGPLAGRRQTVHRGELYAILVALEKEGLAVSVRQNSTVEAGPAVEQRAGSHELADGFVA